MKSKLGFFKMTEGQWYGRTLMSKENTHPTSMVVSTAR